MEGKSLIQHSRSFFQRICLLQTRMVDACSFVTGSGEVVVDYRTTAKHKVNQKSGETSINAKRRVNIS